MLFRLLACTLLFAGTISFAQPPSNEALLQQLEIGVTRQVEVDIYADLAYNHAWTDAAKAHDFASKGIELADAIGYELGRAKCLSEAGLALLYQGFGPESLEYLFEALEILNGYDDAFWKFTTLSSIGYVYWELNEQESAIEYFKWAQPYTEFLGIVNYKISILSDIGETYIQLMQVDSGMKYIQHSFDLAIEHKDTFQIAVTSNQLGILYRLSNRLEDALEYSRLGLPFARVAEWNTRSVYINMAEVFSQRSQLDSSIYYASQGIIAAKAGSFLDENLLRGYTLLAANYEQLGMQDSMVVYLRKQIETNSLIVSKEKTKRIQGIVFDRQLNSARIEQARKEAEMNASLRRQRMVIIVVLAIALIIGIFSFLLLKQKKEIQFEKDRSEKLLLNILPAEIAAELKENGKAEAKDCELVSILFTDFKAFTEASAKLGAQELVAEINACFETFDSICGKYKIEKIKTIGDAYMAAGGLPLPTDDSVKNTVLAALEMQEFITHRKKTNEAKGELAFEMRVGIHTGPVVAGIVGVKKFQYDVWGDTVNTASRVEGLGEPGKVNISQRTYELLKTETDLTFTSRGIIEAKGKGAIHMWFVEKALRI
jgi:class 3 adenylate cyclase